MSILLDADDPGDRAGLHRQHGSFHAQEMIHVRHPGGGRRHARQGRHDPSGPPVFNSVRDAVKATGATASMVFVPPPFAADSLMEAADAGLRPGRIITDGIPAQDMIHVKRYLRRYPRSEPDSWLKTRASAFGSCRVVA